MHASYSRNMRTALTLALVLTALALRTAGPATPAVAPSGIRGTVSRSPTSPVCTAGVPCSAPAAGITLVALRGGVRVATAMTSAAGRYRFVLRPGTYVVRLLRAPTLGGLSPRTVRVVQGRFTPVNLVVDTGIR